MEAEAVLPFPLGSHFEVCRVRPAFFDGFGLGMQCTEAVPKGEELLSIPVAKCWTPLAARNCQELADLGCDVLDATSDASLIALHILLVKSQGEAAEDFRRDHVAALTVARFETLLDWCDKDIEMLAGSKWAMVAPACRQDIKQEFAELQDVLGDFLEAHSIDGSDFLWAHKVLISRSVQIFMEDGSMLYILGPGQDMFNHSAEAPIGNDDVNLQRSEVTGDQSLVIRAYKDFDKGEQAFYSYSSSSNGRLLMCAGFVIPNNPFDAVELALTFPVTEASLPLYLKLSESLDAGIRRPGSAVAEETKDEFLEVCRSDDEQHPSAVTLHVRLFQRAARAQLERVLAFFRLEALCRKGVALSRDTLLADDGDSESRTRALQHLRGSLQSMLQAYDRPLEEDEAELAAMEAAGAALDPWAHRRRNALNVLVGEKRIFRNALLLLE